MLVDSLVPVYLKKISHFIFNVFGVYIYNYLAQTKSELNFDIEANAG